MGIRQKLANRIYRTEAATSFPGQASVNKNNPPTFVPELIRAGTWNKDDLDHLETVASDDPVANYIVYKLSENALDDWFKFVDKDGNEIMLEVQKELKMLGAKKALTLALSGERWAGYSWLYTGKNRYIPKTIEGGRIASLHPFTPKECSVFAYDASGNPKTMQLNINVGKGQNTQSMERLTLPAKDFIELNTRPIGRGYKGRSALYSVWDMLVYLRYIYHSMTFYDMKIGAGLFVVKTAKPIKDSAKAAMNRAFADISVKRSLIIDGTEIDNIGFIGAGAGATDFEGHINSVLEMIAAGTGIPKDVLIGATAGAITGSEVNIKSLFATLNQIQSTMEPIIRELVIRMGFSNEEYEIEWNARYAHDEEEQSKIAMNNAQTLATQTWLTPNEKRALAGYPSIEGGDELVGPIQSKEDDKTADEQDQTRNLEGTNI